MVELIVALMAGLIVAAGIVGLSREATNTFHEEARASSAEAALRAALDRLRADLQRAGYMSTGNITTDPWIAKTPGGANVDPGSPVGIQYLASIALTHGGSSANVSSPLGLSQPTPINPDLIQISGNMTTADQYDIAYIAPASGGCTQIYLSPSSPAMYRLTGSGDAGASELAAAFQPDGASAFMLRIVDDSGRTQYLETGSGCPGGTAGITGGTPWVMVNTAATLLRVAGTPATAASGTESTGTVGSLTGYAAGRAWVNPVQTVQWEITSASSTTDPEPAQYVNGLANTSGPDATKYDLMRSFVAADGTLAKTTSEIVAEYAVDLAFAFSYDSGTSLTPSITTYALDDATDNTKVGGYLKTNATATPERIRSVHARLAIRAAQADRAVNISIAPGQYGTQTYTYRYCVANCPSPAANALAWARVRTVTTEVALPNQSRNFY